MTGYFYHHYRSFAVRPRFATHPPEDLRKSNFFNFTIELRAGNDLVDIQEAQFLNFLNEDGATSIRNGMKYKIRIRYPNDMVENKDLYVTLVDASNSQPIRYEGYDANPKMQRVLLTHEAICTRCSLQKSCGNKNEAPSDPLLVSKGVLKFFMKCNQNCLKNAGNPRDMRRFAIALSFEDITEDQSKILDLSNKMFVHNNSKHNRKRKKVLDVIKLEPGIEEDFGVLAHIHPRVGVRESSFAFYSRDCTDDGVSFRIGNMQMMITSILPRVAATVLIPQQTPLGVVTVTVCMNNIPVFSFPYEVVDKHRYFMRDTSGFLCLYRPDSNAEGKLGVENRLVYVTMIQPPDHLIQPFVKTTRLQDCTTTGIEAEYNYRRLQQEEFQPSFVYPPPMTPIPYNYAPQQYCPTSPTSSNSTNVSSTESSSPIYPY